MRSSSREVLRCLNASRKGQSPPTAIHWRCVWRNFDNLRKQAKQLVHWHRAGNYSVGGRIRSLARYRNLTDVDALALEFPLSEAQEIIALESGYENWAALKSGLPTMTKQAKPVLAVPVLKGAYPVVFVSNVQTSAAFFRDNLGFSIDFLHGHPPFYASVSRGAARLHLRFVHEPVITPGVREREQGLLSAFLDVDNTQSVCGIQSCGWRFLPTPPKGTLGNVCVYSDRSGWKLYLLRGLTETGTSDYRIRKFGGRMRTIVAIEASQDVVR